MLFSAVFIAFASFAFSASYSFITALYQPRKSPFVFLSKSFRSPHALLSAVCSCTQPAHGVLRPGGNFFAMVGSKKLAGVCATVGAPVMNRKNVTSASSVSDEQRFLPHAVSSDAFGLPFEPRLLSRIM